MLKNKINEILHWFALLTIVFIPASFHFFPFQQDISQFIFSWIPALFDLKITDFSSDTESLYTLVLFLMLISVLIVVAHHFWSGWESRKPEFLSLVRIIIVYYLASRLMVYGFDKIFKTQFYLPEPNIAYTPFGLMEKDILFWSVMGTSKLYCIATGVIEVIAASLLLFKKTRVLGLLISVGILTHVLLINLGFDISVKLYSFLLLFISLLALSPQLKPLYCLLIKRENVALAEEERLSIKSPIRKSLKFLVIGMILIEAIKFPLTTGYFSDDNLPRHELHGAYEYEEPSHVGLERFYFHRRNFLIFEFSGYHFESYEIKFDKSDKIFTAENESKDHLIVYAFKLYQQDEQTFVELRDMKTGHIIRGRKIEYRGLPALKDDFHWTIESYAK
ncbi:hypothetical protein K6119_14575 [Paracrocinitomix mangrovi]|uniref:hypothetical protein n=1 Tax=Paracrocinitomix mangrovi TaxID=2862509 RepID=UPI001EDBC245|nr:hypothetical protein [Paracrocinitomix mangrovi]UKN00957.1 hypothetical protein K6119_14575 [Paracrocinitomix mangrovi]